VTYFIAQIMPYITVTIFVLGVLYRLGRWAGARIVHNITLAPFPQSNAEVVGIYARQIVLFENIFRFDMPVWVGGWIFHVALFMILGGHVMGIYFLGRQFMYIGLSAALSEHMSELLGTTFGVIALIALFYLLYRRVAVDKVRRVSNPSDYLHLLLLIAIVAVGDFMRLFPGYGIEYAPVKEYITTLVMFQPAAIPSNPLFITHIFLVQILLIIFPFSKLMHLFGMFGMRWIENRVYKDPAPGLPNVDVAAARAAGAGLAKSDVA